MEARISENVHYIGVNDRTTARFEGLWPIPTGVSYNSYLVVGNEKSAIIDGVDASYAPRQIEAIRHLLVDRRPDYLIINHMEPDHSGSIAVLQSAFPDITIVGNALTLAMANGFYNLNCRTLTVRDGETLSLGSDTTLRFFLTPMVHWPETMMTLAIERHTLFSGDAFGCFGALSGAVMDSDMDVEPYFSEMVRYYSNIVGKYGRFVQKAIDHVGGLDFDTVCPTHGPVWREHIHHVMSLYSSLASYEPLDEGATVVYGSMYGNTARMAEAVAQGLAQSGIRQIAIHDASVSDISYILADIFRHRRLVLAAPTYSDGLFPPMDAVLQAIAARGISNRLVAVVGSHTWAPKSLKSMTDALASCDIRIISDGLSIKQAPDASAIDACRKLGNALATYESED